MFPPPHRSTNSEDLAKIGSVLSDIMRLVTKPLKTNKRIGRIKTYRHAGGLNYTDDIVDDVCIKH